MRPPRWNVGIPLARTPLITISSQGSTYDVTTLTQPAENPRPGGARANMRGSPGSNGIPMPYL